ncbi:OmpA family protein [Pseudodesulfovibrio sp. JC047]|uniref:OmpA family protein n=1 Tax=Pseudodesulfovibrio sp. JC047 TaxID=2683199 RepID=UPI0013D49A35|nr:OmpA family protein [Pseudodesulfovibrio sp. JC047]NDV20424.1 OmpA family protein [Pseudodesulfovibrio sp. JC047]
MNQSRKMLMLTLAAVMVFTFAMAATANAKMVKQVDNFIMFVDQSGSMAMTHDGLGEKKIEMAVKTMRAMNQAIPDLDYNSAVFMFAPFDTVCPPKAYNKATVDAAITKINTDFEIFNRNTPMGNGLADVAPVVASMSGKTALVIFTDGKSNIGADPVGVAQELHQTYGDNLCVHVVSFADTPAGDTIINGIRNAFPCSVVADAGTLMDQAAMDQYAEDVFYDVVADPVAVPVVTPMAKEVVSFNLNFGFDKYEITDEMVPVLEQAKMILEEDTSAMYEVSGYTDSTGAEMYNQGLSERRANSVVKWMTDNGVDASRLEAKGYGETNPKYDNATKEGRRLNRRVEIQTK